MTVEDDYFIFTPWAPSPIRNTLMPVPEQIIEPADSLEEAHEAMLYAMEEATNIKVEIAEKKPEQESVGKTTELERQEEKEVPMRARDKHKADLLEMISQHQITMKHGLVVKLLRKNKWCARQIMSN